MPTPIGPKILRGAPYFPPSRIQSNEARGEEGATFAYGPIPQPYGMKEFAARDPHGYVLGFGEAVQG